MNELVSIVIPIYNAEAYLKKCVDSVINQTYKNIEILLIDDGSMDGSPIICDSYAIADKRVRVMHKKNGGSSSARECGILNFTGNYLMFVDADDYIEKNTIEECVNIAVRYNADCVCFSYYKDYKDKSIGIYNIAKEGLYKGETKKEIYKRLFGPFDKHLAHPEHIDSLSSCCFKLYKRKVIEKARFFDTSYVGSCEDGLLNAYALYYADSIYFLNECFYHYIKVNANSLTSIYRKDLYENWQNLYKEFMNCINEHKLSDDYIEALNNRFIFSMIGLGLNELCNPNKKEQIANLKTILSSEPYKLVLKHIDYSNMQFKWRIFIFVCKHKMTLALKFLLVSIKYLKSKV